MTIILASASPRRRELMTNMGFNFKVVTADIDENTNAENVAERVEKTAEKKTAAVAEKEKGIIVAADTVVSIDGRVLGKPKDENEAFSMLSLLSGKRHEVYTGVCIKSNKKRVVFSEKTSVYFRRLSEKEIWDYIKSGEPMDKAGAYGIQGRGALFVRKINGDYPNVVGLPVTRLYTVLLEEFDAEGVCYSE
jgi:septum formation protein